MRFERTPGYPPRVSLDSSDLFVPRNLLDHILQIMHAALRRGIFAGCHFHGFRRRRKFK